jgi:signal transduction histidine kinase
MNPITKPEPALWVRIGLPIVALIGAMLLLPIADVRGRGLNIPLSFGQSGSVAAVLDLFVGQALLISGVAAWLLGPRARIGTLAVLAGVCWFGPDLFAAAHADPLVRAMGRFALTPFLGVLLLHLVAAALGVDDRPPARVALLGLYAAAGAVALGSALTYDAFFDPFCVDCTWQNPLAIARGPGAVRSWQELGAALAVTVAAALALATAVWVSRGARTAARAFVAGSAIGVACASAARGALLLAAPRAVPTDERWAVAWALLVLSCIALSTGIGGLAVETWRRAARMRSIGDSLEVAPTPGTLESALTRVLADPSLRLAYAVGADRTVDQSGAELVLSDGPGRTVTSIERDGERLALVAHGRNVDADALSAAFGTATLVALDNERLRAARLAQLVELQASRARIVEVADAERRRLERDLHDGIQQELLTILFDVRLTRLAAERTGEAGRAEALRDAEAESQQSVDVLRHLAHGIHPQILSRSGLVAALESLADESPIPLELEAGDVGRIADRVEAAAYQVVADAVRDATVRGATGIAVKLARAPEGRLHVELRDDGRRRAGTDDEPIVPDRIADRVGAAGGEAVARPTYPGTLLTVDLPCG